MICRVLLHIIYNIYICSMNVYEAINEMRRMSERREEFSFSFMSYSITKDSSEGEVVVEHAILYKNPKDSKNIYQDYMLTYLDTDTGKVRQCWQPLIMTFNQEQLTNID